LRSFLSSYCLPSSRWAGARTTSSRRLAFRQPGVNLSHRASAPGRAPGGPTAGARPPRCGASRTLAPRGRLPRRREVHDEERRDLPRPPLLMTHGGADDGQTEAGHGRLKPLLRQPARVSTGHPARRPGSSVGFVSSWLAPLSGRSSVEAVPVTPARLQDTSKYLQDRLQEASTGSVEVQTQESEVNNGPIHSQEQFRMIQGKVLVTGATGATSYRRKAA
jgi:hypothetical protein